MASHITDGILGSIVALVTTPLGVGPALGGWIAGRRSETPAQGALRGGIAGTLGALPSLALVYLAVAGRIAPTGYHEGMVHVGVNTAAPGTFVLWQELALTGLVGLTFVGMAVAGGVVAGLKADVVGEVRADLSGEVE